MANNNNDSSTNSSFEDNPKEKKITDENKSFFFLNSIEENDENENSPSSSRRSSTNTLVSLTLEEENASNQEKTPNFNLVDLEQIQDNIRKKKLVEIKRLGKIDLCDIDDSAYSNNDELIDDNSPEEEDEQFRRMKEYFAELFEGAQSAINSKSPLLKEVEEDYQLAENNITNILQEIEKSGGLQAEINDLNSQFSSFQELYEAIQEQLKSEGEEIDKIKQRQENREKEIQDYESKIEFLTKDNEPSLISKLIFKNNVEFKGDKKNTLIILKHLKTVASENLEDLRNRELKGKVRIESIKKQEILINEAVDNVNFLQKIIEDISSERDTIREEFEKLKEGLVSKKKFLIQNYEGKNGQIIQEYLETKLELESEMNNLEETDIDESKISQLEEKVKNLAEAVLKLNDGNTQLGSELLKEEQELIKKSQEELINSYNSCQEKLLENQIAINQSRTDLEERQKQYQIISLEQRISELETELRKSKKTTSSLGNDELEKEKCQNCENLHKELVELKSKLEELQEKLEHVESEQEIFEEDGEKKTQFIEELKSQIKNLEGKVQELGSALSNTEMVEKNWNQLVEESKEKQKKIDELNLQLAIIQNLLGIEDLAKLKEELKNNTLFWWKEEVEIKDKLVNIINQTKEKLENLKKQSKDNENCPQGFVKNSFIMTINKTENELNYERTISQLHSDLLEREKRIKDLESELSKSKTKEIGCLPQNREFLQKEEGLLKTINRLEEEKKEYLDIIDDYKREQKIAIATFIEQEENIQKKDKQLFDKDEEISTLSKQVAGLKERLSQISEEKKQLKENKNQEFEISLKNIQEENDEKLNNLRENLEQLKKKQKEQEVKLKNYEESYKDLESELINAEKLILELKDEINQFKQDAEQEEREEKKNLRPADNPLRRTLSFKRTSSGDFPLDLGNITGGESLAKIFGNGIISESPLPSPTIANNRGIFFIGHRQTPSGGSLASLSDYSSNSPICASSTVEGMKGSVRKLHEKLSKWKKLGDLLGLKEYLKDNGKLLKEILEKRNLKNLKDLLNKLDNLEIQLGEFRENDSTLLEPSFLPGTPLSNISSSPGKANDFLNNDNWFLERLTSESTEKLVTEKRMIETIANGLGLELEKITSIDKLIDAIKELIRSPFTNFEQGNESNKDLINASQSLQNDDYEKIKKENQDLKKKLRLIKRELSNAVEEANAWEKRIDEIREEVKKENIEKKTNFQSLKNEKVKFQKLWKESEKKMRKNLENQIEIPVN